MKVSYEKVLANGNCEVATLIASFANSLEQHIHITVVVGSDTVKFLRETA